MACPQASICVRAADRDGGRDRAAPLAAGAARARRDGNASKRDVSVQPRRRRVPVEAPERARGRGGISRPRRQQLRKSPRAPAKPEDRRLPPALWQRRRGGGGRGLFEVRARLHTADSARPGARPGDVPRRLQRPLPAAAARGGVRQAERLDRRRGALVCARAARAPHRLLEVSRSGWSGTGRCASTSSLAAAAADRASRMSWRRTTSGRARGRSAFPRPTRARPRRSAA